MFLASIFLPFQLLHLFCISFRRNVKTIPNDIWYRDLIIWAPISISFNVISVAFYFSFTPLAQLHLYVYWDFFGLQIWYQYCYYLSSPENIAFSFDLLEQNLLPIRKHEINLPKFAISNSTIHVHCTYRTIAK